MMKSFATFAGGCFWCTEAIFRRLKGVSKVISGFSGGSTDNPTYEDIIKGNTGHAEAIQIEFDPSIISYKELLNVFFKLHNPTTLNRQDYDMGTQYRSIIFFHDDEQKKHAYDVKKQLEISKYYSDPIITEIIPFKKFFIAEDYHQEYYEKNFSAPYCEFVIDPKLDKLKQDFKDLIR